MSTSRLSQLLKLSKGLPIRLPQNSNLTIRTPPLPAPPALSLAPSPVHVNVKIVPEWRDDGYITLEHSLQTSSHNDNSNNGNNGNNTGNNGNNTGNNSNNSNHSEHGDAIDWHVQVEQQTTKTQLTNVDVLIDYKSSPDDGDCESNSNTNDDHVKRKHKGTPTPTPTPTPTITATETTNSDAISNDEQLKLAQHNKRSSSLNDGSDQEMQEMQETQQMQQMQQIKKVMTDDGTIITDPQLIRQFEQKRSNTLRKVHHSDNIIHYTNHDSNHDNTSPSNINLVAKVPQKCNLTCHLHQGGNIHITKKLEAEHGFDLYTTNGSIFVDKLRGNKIDLVSDSIIHVQKSCEAQELNVRVGQPQQQLQQQLQQDDENNYIPSRFRAKMINVSNANIQVHETNLNHHRHHSRSQPLDDDDGQSIIDISSVYASQSGDGVHLEVLPTSTTYNHHTAMKEECPRKVRVKSNHGHISVRAATSIFDSSTEHSSSTSSTCSMESDQQDALVTLGGVNGSFDVAIEARGNNDNDKSHQNDKNHDDKIIRYPLASNIHVDSLSPGQISVLTTDHGDVGLTLDRKIEADLSLLSSPLINNLDPNVLLEEDEDELVKSLTEHDDDIHEFYKSASLSKSLHKNVLKNPAIVDSNDDNNDDDKVVTSLHRIDIETNAFSGKQISPMKYLEYVHGSVENKSEEPDSRFDVKTKGIKTKKFKSYASIGKINIEGAAGQALEGFSGRSDIDDNSGFERPMVAIGTDGKIKVESLSWFGAISRRYGVKEDGRDLGRQAIFGKGTRLKSTKNADE